MAPEGSGYTDALAGGVPEQSYGAYYGTDVSNNAAQGSGDSQMSGEESQNVGGGEQGEAEDTRTEREKAEEELARASEELTKATEEYRAAERDYNDAKGASDAAAAEHRDASSHVQEAQEIVDRVDGYLEEAERKSQDTEKAAEDKEREREGVQKELDELREAEREAEEKLQGVYIEGDFESTQKRFEAADAELDKTKAAFLGEDERSGVAGEYWNDNGRAQAAHFNIDDDLADPVYELDKSVGRLAIEQIWEDTDGDGTVDHWEWVFGAIRELDEAQRASDQAHSMQDRIAAETKQVEEEKKDAEGRVEELQGRIDTLTKRRSALDGDDGKVAKAEEELESKRAAREAADGELDSARRAYDEAQGRLEGATPETLGELTAAAKTALGELEAAQEKREAALSEELAQQDKVDELKGERENAAKELDESPLIEDLRHARDDVNRLSQELQRLSNEATNAAQWVSEKDEELKKAKEEYEVALGKYESAKKALTYPNGRPLNRDVAVILDAAERLVNAERAYSAALAEYDAARIANNDEAGEAWECLRFCENFVGFDEEGEPILKNENTDEDRVANLLDGVNKYKELRSAYEQAKKNRQDKEAELGALDDQVRALREAHEDAVADAKNLGKEQRVSHDLLELATDRDKIAEVADRVLEGPRDEAEAAYRDARAAYTRAAEAYRRAYYALYPPQPVEEESVERRVRRAVDDYFGGTDEPASEESTPATKAATTTAATSKDQRTAEAREALARAAAGASTTQAEGVAGGAVSVTGAPTLEEIADGVFEVRSMPEVDVDALVAADPDHTADDVKEIWWCVIVDGVRVRVMDALGRLAPGLARVVWAEDAEGAQAALEGIDLGDGTVIVITPDTELSLEVVWA